MENHGSNNGQSMQGEKPDTLASREEIMKIFRECSIEDLRKRKSVIISALEKNHAKKEKNDNIKKLIKRYEWEKKIISEILEEEEK